MHSNIRVYPKTPDNNNFKVYNNYFANNIFTHPFFVLEGLPQSNPAVCFNRCI